jgi:hypothetical protein
MNKSGGWMNSLPGPSSYQNQEHNVIGKHGSPAYSISPKRPDCRILAGKESPGPGVYTAKYDQVLNQSPNNK